MKLETKMSRYRHKRMVTIILSVIIIIMMLFFQNAAFGLRTISAISFIILFYFIDHFFDVNFKPHHYLLIVIIAVFGSLLSPLYFLYSGYDKVLHLIQPVFVFSIVFYMVSKLNLAFKWKMVFSFFIVLGILGLFEIGEFILDLLFDLKLQGVYIRDVKGLEKLNVVSGPHRDTMIDLSFGVLGLALYTLIISLLHRRRLKVKK